MVRIGPGASPRIDLNGPAVRCVRCGAAALGEIDFSNSSNSRNSSNSNFSSSRCWRGRLRQVRSITALGQGRRLLEVRSKGKTMRMGDERDCVRYSKVQ